MIGFKRLSEEAMEKYDYKATKRNVDKYMEPLYELIFKYTNIIPPRICSTIKEVDIQFQRNTSSIVEKYVIKKITTEEQVREYYIIIENILNMLRDDERICFKAEYLEPLPDEEVAEKMNISTWTVIQIRKSCIIKFALALDLAVLKGE